MKCLTMLRARSVKKPILMTVSWMRCTTLAKSWGKWSKVRTSEGTRWQTTGICAEIYKAYHLRAKMHSKLDLCRKCSSEDRRWGKNRAALSRHQKYHMVSWARAALEYLTLIQPRSSLQWLYCKMFKKVKKHKMKRTGLTSWCRNYFALKRPATRKSLLVA